MVIDFINQSLGYFQIDNIKKDAFKIELSSARFKITRVKENYNPKPHHFPIAFKEKCLFELNTKHYAGLSILIPSGAGKTHFLKQAMKEANSFNRSYWRFDKIICIDPKGDGDFDEFESKKFLIIRNLDDSLDFYRKLEQDILEGKKISCLILFEEFAIYTDKSFYKNQKENEQKAIELAARVERCLMLYRSKGVFTVVSGQLAANGSSPINLNLFPLKIFGYLNQSQGRALGIPNQFHERSDLKHGKFLLFENGECCLIKGFK